MRQNGKEQELKSRLRKVIDEDKLKGEKKSHIMINRKIEGKTDENKVKGGESEMVIN